MVPPGIEISSILKTTPGNASLNILRASGSSVKSKIREPGIWEIVFFV
jgi:hypothetical protein